MDAVLAAGKHRCVWLRTITAVFADGRRLDMPWEVVDGYVDD